MGKTSKITWSNHPTAYNISLWALLAWLFLKNVSLYTTVGEIVCGMEEGGNHILIEIL